MRLSEIKGERVFDVIADIVEPISNIAEDGEAMKLFQRERLPDGMTAKKFLADRAKRALPALLKNHKSDIVTILSAIAGTSPDEYAKTLTMAKLMKDVAELLTDEAFGELFISAQSQTEEEPSGSAPESTEAKQKPSHS